MLQREKNKTMSTAKTQDNVLFGKTNEIVQRDVLDEKLGEKSRRLIDKPANRQTNK